MRIGFDPTSYSVSESDGVVMFSIVKVGESDISVSVRFSTEDGSARGMYCGSR